MMKKNGILLRLRMFVMVNINNIRIITLVLFYEQDLRNKILSRKFYLLYIIEYYVSCFIYVVSKKGGVLVYYTFKV